MAAGTKTKGEDGILKKAAGNDVACLRSWTLESNANIATLEGRCMKSNDDGGSGVAAPWDDQVVSGKSWSVSAEMFWQVAPVGVLQLELEPIDVGNEFVMELYPNNETTGKPYWTGTVIVESVGIPSEVDGYITQSVTLRGKGALTQAVAA